MIYTDDVHHAPDCGEKLFKLMQKGRRPDLMYRISCQTCGAWGEPFPEKDLGGKWPEGTGLVNVSETVDNKIQLMDPILNSIL